MTDLQNGIITLIKSGISGQKLPLPSNFSIEEAYPLLVKHQITALSYEGAVNCGLPKDNPVMQRLFKLNYKNLLKSEGQDREIDKFCRLFEENGIDYLLMKGAVLKDIYPRRELRQMGDADILIKEKQYKQIAKLIKTQGYRQKVGSDHAYIWYNKLLTFEVHKRPVPADNVALYDYFGNGWSRAKHKSGHCYVFTPEDEFIFIFAHFAKHYLLGGIGCRQIIDMWLFKDANPQMDFDYIKTEIEKIHLSQFYLNTMRLISSWFEGETLDDITSLMTDYIFSSGSWGTEENKSASKSLLLKKFGESADKTKLRRFLRLFFPTSLSLKGRYRILEKGIIFLPAVWLVRWFDILANRPKNVAYRLKQTNDLTDENLKKFESDMIKSGLLNGK